jgi:hypothetical protein
VGNFREQLTVCARKNQPFGNIGRIVEPDFFDKARNEFNGNLQLTAPRGVIGQNIEETLKRLYHTSVAEPDVGVRPINYLAIAPSRTRERLWLAFQKRDLLRPKQVKKEIVLKGKHAPWTFDLGYENGALNVINSLALNAPTSQANLGRALVLKGMIDDVRAIYRGTVKGIAVVEGAGDGSRGSHAAQEILADGKLTVVPFSQLNELIDRVKRDLSRAV